MVKKSKKKSVRNILINFVIANGPQTYKQLHTLVLAVAGQPITRNEYGSSYLDKYSWGTSACLPTDTDSRHLLKSEVDGLYHAVAE